MHEEFCPDTPVFRLNFSNIKCNIHLEDHSVLVLAVKIGKNYSLPTSKTQLINGVLTFPDSISIPVSEEIIYDNNLRKEKVPWYLMKCEVMLYKHPNEQKNKPTQLKKLSDNQSTKKQKEKKNLIGMASLIINGELFSQKVKSFRLTNTFDKDATITCSIKISHDIFNNQEQRISSIGQKSQTSSVHKANNCQQDRIQNGSIQLVKIQKQLNSKYKKPKMPELNISRMSEQNKPVSTKEVGSYSERQMAENYEESELTKTQRIYGVKQPIFSGRIKRNDRNVQSYSERYESQNSNKDQESQDIFQLCNNLQEQNNLLMNKIQNLQNHILNKSPSVQTAYLQQQSKLNKSQSLVKPSMIKKNNTFTASASTWVTKVSDPKSVGSTKEKSQQKQTGSQSPKILPNESNFSFKPPVRMISIKEMDVEHESSKVITPRSQFAEKISFGFNQNSQAIHFQNIEVKDQRKQPPMRIDSVVTISYVPPVQPIVREFSESSKPRTQRVDKSVSEIERSFSKSYSKFNSVKKHYIESNQNKISILKEIEKKQFGLQTDDQDFPDFPRLINLASEIQTPVFVSVNGVMERSNRSMLKSQNQAKKTQPGNEMSTTSRATLEDLNQLIQQKYRKAEKSLKQANEQLQQENKSLKKQKKLLESEVQQKKNFSMDEFMRLQSSTESQQKEVKYYIDMLQEKDEQIKNLSQELQKTQQQNEKLQKNLREQKKTMAYFIKTSHFHDEKQKELEMKLKFIEDQFNYQDSSLHSDSNNSKHNILMPSPKVVCHPMKKQQDIYSTQYVKRESQGIQADRSNHNQNVSMSQYVPQIRFSVTKMTQNQKKVQKTTPFSKSLIAPEREQSIESKGLLSLKRHSVINTKQIQSSSQEPNLLSNMLVNLNRTSEQKGPQNGNSSLKMSEKKGLTIDTKL